MQNWFQELHASASVGIGSQLNIYKKWKSLHTVLILCSAFYSKHNALTPDGRSHIWTKYL